MNYAEFKDHLADFAWRKGDVEFSTAIDSHIKMANALLSRELRTTEMQNADLLIVTAQDMPLPADLASIRLVSKDDSTPMRYVSPYDLMLERARIRDGEFSQVYSLSDKTGIRFAGAVSSTLPQTVLIDYYTKVPDFAATDTSWLADNYLDLYTYAVLMHTATWMADEARLAEWKAALSDALRSMNVHEERTKYSGAPLSMPLPGVVA